jgi:hypothetical protein
MNALQSDEIMLTGGPFDAHAEVIIMEWGSQMGYEIIAIGAGRAPCPPCQAMANSIGVLLK